MLWTIAVLLVIFMILFAFLYANRDKFSGILIQEVNKQLTTAVSVSDVNVSLRKFPSASFVFSDVFSQGAYSTPGDTLIYAKKIYLQFSIWQVLFSSVSINEINVEKAVLNIRLRDKGRDNFRIWKEDSASSEGLFTLEKVSLEEVQTYVEDPSADFSTHFNVKRLVFNGNFGESYYTLENKGGLDIQDLMLGKTPYLSSMPLQIDFTLQGYPDSVVIKPALLKWENLAFNFSTTTSGGETHVTVSSPDLDLEKVQVLMEEQGWYNLKKVDLKGKGSVRFAGIFGEGREPDFTLNFAANEASVEGYRDVGVKNISCSGTYTRRGEGDVLEVNSFSGRGETGSVEGRLMIRDLNNPFVNMDLRSDLELAEWLVLFPVDTVENAGGKAIVDLHFENQFGSLKKIKASELRKARTQGSLRIENASFQFLKSDKTVNSINGELNFSGNNLQVERLYFKTGKSDIYLEGRFENVLNFVLLEDQRLLVDCSVKAQEIDLSDFVGSQKKGSDRYNLDFAKSLDLELRLGVDRFSFQQFHASDISGNLNIRNRKIEVSQLSLKANKGFYKGQFSIDLNAPDRYRLTAGLKADAINVHELFVSFNDFGQEAIAADNIYGTATADIDFESYMLPDLTVLTETIDMTARIRIKDGNLKNYAPMRALSRFADIKELEDVRFSSLDNTISIHQSQVMIPKMDVISNVLSLQVNGAHNFDNQINYTMRLKLDDVLFSKKTRKVKKSEFDEHLVEVKMDDDPYIYVKMIGKASDPEISLDRESLGNSISRDLKQQGEEIRKIFKKDKPEEKKKDDTGIIFEWEESDSGKK